MAPVGELVLGRDNWFGRKDSYLGFKNSNLKRTCTLKCVVDNGEEQSGV